MSRPSFERAAAALVAVLLSACVRSSGASSAVATASREDIYVLRSIREQREADAGFCESARTGFEPLPKDAERFFSFWSLEMHPESGRLANAHVARVAELRGCFGATSEPARQRFYAEIKLGSTTVEGHGECVAAAIDVPEAGLFPVRCQLTLSGSPPYVGGLLTTNTIASKARFGGASDPAGYTQASIATIRLWHGEQTQ